LQRTFRVEYNILISNLRITSWYTVVFPWTLGASLQEVPAIPALVLRLRFFDGRKRYEAWRG
jgi:hypothetical protein